MNKLLLDESEANSLLKEQLEQCDIKDFQSLTDAKFIKFLELVKKSYQVIDENSYKINHSLSHSRYDGMVEMIGNIAHQWRQPLSAISSLVTGAKLRVELGISNEDDVPETFNQILSHVNYLNQTIADFTNFLKDDKKKRDFDLFEVLLLTLSIIDKSFSDGNIKIYMKDYIFTTKSYGLSHEISQVLLNILSNAKDALLLSKNKNRAIYIDMEEDVENNIIKIIDNGDGINQQILDKIFDPYFTTKHQSVGTGIGLYASKDIIENHLDGRLFAQNINTKIDGINYKGACFTLLIPKSFRN
ncbi:MAG: HAMP domain-containing sensor histidine kinase [Arcobacteraceae bacterium]|jgi:signal transduction histidine kinase|nr:HAMP domain-containing sensor histidine kinase [Arcobacteraceae bacterium]